MGVMDIVFGPFEKWGMKGAIIILILTVVIASIFAIGLTTVGLSPFAAMSFVVDFTLTYGALFAFLYVMWYNRPK